MTAQINMTDVESQKDSESVSIELPELTEEDLALAHREDNMDWCRNVKENAPIGVLFQCKSCMELYRVSQTTIRCHQVYADTIRSYPILP